MCDFKVKLTNAKSLILSRIPVEFHGFATGSAWLVVAASLGQGAMLVANVLNANFLGSERFGLYSLIQTTILTLAGTAQLSLSLVVTQQLSILRERNTLAAGEIAGFSIYFALLSSFIVASILIAFREPIVDTLFGQTEINQSLMVGALALPFATLSLIQQGIFNGLQRFRDQAFVALLAIPFVIVCPAVGALVSGVDGALVGLVAAYMFRSLAAHVRLRRALRHEGIRLRIGNILAKFRLLTTHSLPATLSGLASMLAVWGGQTLLIRSNGGSESVGLFAAAFAIKTLAMFLPTQMVGALMPALSRYHAREVSGNDRRLLYLNAVCACGIAAGVAIFGVLFSSHIMKLFGSSFDGGSYILRLLLIATPLEALTITLYQEVQSKGLFWKNFFWVNMPLSATVILASAALVPIYAGEGLALAWLIGWVVALIGTICALVGIRNT